MRSRSTDMAEAHVLVFPWPLQGHINGMLPFAGALLDAGVHVTFLHTEHNLRRLGQATSEQAAGSSARLRFLSIPDGLPDDRPRSACGLSELDRSLREVGSVRYRALLASLLHAGAAGEMPVSSVVADGLMPWAVDIAEDLGILAIAFRTSSASSVLAYLSAPQLSSELAGGLDEPVRGVPGMESFLRRRDLPSFFRRRDDPLLDVLAEVTAHSSKRARALVLNSTASLEGAALAHIAPRVRDVFAIGPLHAMYSPASSSSLWSEDGGCVAWLDGQADRSVVYVSLGSLATISHEQFTEFLSGLAAAGYPFLWVLRPGMVAASQDDVLQEVARATGGDAGERARVVAWAPQRDVLRHRAVGCFLTHAGWNSTLEGVAEGVPMVCWPFFGDQQINSRLVGDVWRNGLDMKDVCERGVVERMLREAMENDDIRRSAEALALQVKRDVAAGGSSATEFQRLLSFIRDLSASSPNTTPGLTQ